MKLKEEHIKYIKNTFIKMKSKEDFVSLLNYCKSILYDKHSMPFEIHQINYYSNPNACKKRYNSFSIKKKSGSNRNINSPVNGLKIIQKCLNLIFQTVNDINPAANGFVPNKSIVDNAKIHVGKIYVYNIDLKDFFPSIDQARIWGRLKYPPFNLNERNGRLELANIIASLCCNEMEVERFKNGNWIKEMKFVLPQGAPTSPVLTNIICQKLDFYLTAVAKRFNLNYSRYADDITFSSMHNVYNKDGDFLKELHRIISEQNFHINESKTRLQKQGYRQEVTGLIVNEKLNINSRYIKQIRMYLYYWEAYGFDRANSIFQKKYKTDKSNVKKGNPNLQNVISGKLEYLKMVKGNDNNVYLNLKKRFNQLNNITTPISDIINIWENEGIEKAMKIFYNVN